jgi:ubiquinone/menaquinone biosynthesis C-methylase UbiE
MSSSEQLSAAFYDRLGAEGLAARTAPLWDDRALGRLREMLTSGQRILDAGCGYGRIAIPLARSGYEVTGLDLSDALLRAARERAEQQGASVRWVRESMCRMPLPDSTFDAVLCLWSAFHELLEEEQVQAVKEMQRVLRPGGWCLIEGPLYRPATAAEIASGQRRGPEHRLSFDIIAGLPNPHYCHDAESFGRLMERAGIASFKVYEQDWAGRPRQFLWFEKRGTSPNSSLRPTALA